MKLKRAKEHIDQLDREVAVWLKHSNPYSATLHLHPDGPHNYFRLRVKDAPEHLSLVFGDAVGNLRASLDHLVHQLALTYCPERTPSQRAAFPIELNRDNYPSVARDRLQSVMPEAWEVFECLQPYNRADWSEVYYLWLINELCNADKHRVLSVVGARGHLTTTTGSSVWLSGKLEDRQEIHLRLEPAKDAYEIHVSALVGVLIEAEAVGVAGLRTMHDFIRDDVFPLFAGFFEERRPFQPLPRNPRKGRRKARGRAKRKS